MEKHYRTKGIHKMGNNILFDIILAPVRGFHIYFEKK